MRRVKIVCIVEGAGEVKAIPILLQRIVREMRQKNDSLPELDVPTPIPVKRNKVVQPGELEPYIKLAASKAGAQGAILILLDADSDCPKELAPRLLKRAKTSRSDIPIAVVFAKREYEAWLLAAAVSLRGRAGLSDELTPPPDAEAVSGAKEWLRKNMPGNRRRYEERVDQPELTKHFDLQAARTTDSFDKLYRDIARLLSELEPSLPEG